MGWMSPRSHTYTRRSLPNHTCISSQRSLPSRLVLSDLVLSSKLLLLSSTNSPSSTSSPSSSTTSSPNSTSSHSSTSSSLISLLDTPMDLGRDSATTTRGREWSAGGSSKERS